MLVLNLTDTHRLSKRSQISTHNMAITTASLVYIVFLAVMIAFNIAGNSLVCLVILKNKAMKTSINWLLFHLAIADLLVAVFFIPPCILSHFIELPSGVVGDLLCKLIFSGYLGWVAAAASSFLLVVIAFERYSATLHPLEKQRSGRSPWLVPIAWVSGFVLLIPLLVVTNCNAQTKQCELGFPDFTATRAYKLTWSIINLVLPISIMGYLYARIIWCLRNRPLVPCSSHKLVAESRKVTKMLISVSAIFITCWTPTAVLCALIPVIPGRYITVHYVSKASALLNSCLNPLVYTLHSQQFRKNLASLMPCCASKLVTTRKRGTKIVT